MSYNIICSSDPSYNPWYCFSMGYARHLHRVLVDELSQRYSVHISVSDSGESSVVFKYPRTDFEIVPVS